MTPENDTSEKRLDEAVRRVTRTARRYADGAEVALQSDEVLRRHVLRGLAQNLLEHGRPYCPCRDVTGVEKRDRVNICPCRTHLEEIERWGECECGLYVAENNSE